MATKTYSALIRTDRELLNAFSSIADRMGSPDVFSLSIRLAADHQVPLKGAYAEIVETPAVKLLLDANTAIAQQFVAAIPSVPSSRIVVDREAGIDKVTISFANDIDADTAAKFLVSTSAYLPAFDQSAAISKALGPELAEFYNRREAGLLRLESFNQQLTEQNVDHRRTVDEQTEQFRAKLAAEHADAVSRLKEEHDANESRIKEREAALETRIREVDDRGSTHVRRELREKLAEKLAARERQFKLSPSTNNKRYAIHAQYIFLIVVAVVVMWTGLNSLLSKSVPEWHDYARTALGLLGIGASTLFYIRWTDDWFRQHANEEFRLRRLDLDIDRASWVVEMAMEWKKEKGEEIPADLVARLTTNLFGDSGGGQAPKHPFEDFAAALLQSSANLKLSLPGGGELNLDRKGMKKLHDTTA